jgi:hypothetical protein
VWRLNDPFPVCKFIKPFLIQFKRNRAVIIHAGDAEDLFGYHKAEVIFPLDAFRSTGKTQTIRTKLFYVHGSVVKRVFVKVAIAFVIANFSNERCEEGEGFVH